MADLSGSACSLWYTYGVINRVVGTFEARIKLFAVDVDFSELGCLEEVFEGSVRDGVYWIR